MEPTRTHERADRRAWWGLAVLALPTLLLALDLSVLYLALPHLSADLGASATQQLWITDVYGFMIAGFLVTMGTLGDRIGRRRLLMIGAAAFGVASVLAAFAPTAGLLIAARALLGIAGATLMPSTLALISTMFRDPAQRATAIAVWMSCFMGGTAIGPLVGGAFLERFWWGAVFLMGVPVMLVLLLAAPVLLPESRDPRAGRLDLPSAGLFLAAILPAVHGLKTLAQDGASAQALALVALGAGLAVVFVRRQLRLDDPLLDLSLFRSRTFSTSLGVNLVGGMIMGSTYLFVTLYLQTVEGLSPLRAGLWLVPGTLVMIGTSMAAPAVARRIGPGATLAVGFGVGAVGLAVLSQTGVGGLALVLVGQAVAAAGTGPTGAVATDLVVGSAPPEKAGSASSMSETSGELGLALGIALLGSLGSAVYRGRMAGEPLVGVDPAAAQTARESIAGAAAVAPRQTGGGDLLGAAQDAFVGSLSVVVTVGGIAMLAFAVLVAAVLRPRAPRGETRSAAISAEQA